MKRALFIFRRDLRLRDNLGLNSALERADEVVLSFIFTPEQIEHNPYKSARCLQFMIESLEELENEIAARGGRLFLFFGSPEKIVEQCIDKLQIDGVFLNHDYTPYSIARDSKIEAVCEKGRVAFEASHDLLLHGIEDTLKADGTPYTVFTPFFRNACKLKVAKPLNATPGRFYDKPIDFATGKEIYTTILPKREAQAPGGRKAALKILQNPQAFTKYPLERDFPALDKTSHLSPHLKFTTCSIREAYYSLNAQSELIRSLYWREFFTLIAYHFPYVFKGAFKPKYDKIPWKNDKQAFQLWTEGKTGFPIVDAGMRELNATGFMHNRARMITASFLIKDLHINWQWGERYFAQRLIDYDPAVNNGNWQWAASTGCDAQPYFRIFNPWSQGKKFDPECEYIKKWVPELSSLSPETIHSGRLPTIVDHAVEAPIALNTYKSF